MRRFLAVSLFSSVGVIGFACSNNVGAPLPVGNDDGAATSVGGAQSASAGAVQSSAGGTAQATSAVDTASADGSTATSATSAGTPSSDSSASTATTTSATTQTSSTTGSPSTTTGSGGGGQLEQCTDVKPDERDISCAQWAAYGECENPNGWLDDFCDLSCGRCMGQTSSSNDGSGGASAATNVTNTTTSTDASSSSTTGQDLGNDNPFPPINGGTNGFATRYWDCCKPSCGWAGNANPTVVSCDKNDQNRSANDTQNACEVDGQSGAFTCHSMAPWAHSNVLSYGFAAVNGVACGTCFQIEFPGTSQRGGNDEGSAALAGKTMVVMATNIGGIEQNQFDLLIPGGGVGALNGCSGQWGIDNSQLGAQYGGFLSDCRQQNPDNHEGAKSCVRDKCESVFGSQGLTELYDGCMWFVDWFEAADNPDIRYQQVSCPSDLTSVAY